MSSDHKHIDEVTGVETTGHVWDHDLRELNKPLPKWWLWVLYVTIVWAIGYWIVYPAWPTFTSYTKGYLGYSQRARVVEDITAAKKAQDKYRQDIAKTDIVNIKKNPELFEFALAGGSAAFGDNCSGCHGQGAQGAIGYPNLNDDDWLWGGSLQQIEHTIFFGVRSGHEQARNSAMPRFGLDGILEKSQIKDLVHYVRSLSGLDVDKAAAERGKALFAEQCTACHGENAKGNQELGAPNLTDSLWLYGNSPDAITYTITTGRGGAMPAWGPRLDPVTVKMLALYVHSLGGGQ